MRARDAGVHGVIVSNHGGRQVDGAVAALDALVEVRAELGDDAVVLMDSGIRSGADVLKALALGADAVLLGRPYAYGLASAGQEGVETAIRHLMAETDLTLALIGGTRRPATSTRRGSRRRPDRARAVRRRGARPGRARRRRGARPHRGDRRLPHGPARRAHRLGRRACRPPRPRGRRRRRAGRAQGSSSSRPATASCSGGASPCGECQWCLRGTTHLCRKPPAARTRPRLADGTRGLGRAADRARSRRARLAHRRRSGAHRGRCLSTEQASLIGCSIATGVCSVLKTAQVWEGARVGVIGCGAVGISVIQGARIAGAGEIHAIDLDERKLEIAKRFGATHTGEASRARLRLRRRRPAGDRRAGPRTCSVTPARSSTSGSRSPAPRRRAARAALRPPRLASSSRTAATTCRPRTFRARPPRGRGEARPGGDGDEDDRARRRASRRSRTWRRETSSGR